MDCFYRALATGVGPAAALQRARQDAVDANRPAAVWAGLVLVGDGMRPPFRQGISTRPFNEYTAVVLSAIALLGLAAVGLVSAPDGTVWANSSAHAV